MDEEKKIEAERLRMVLENNFKDLVRHLRNAPEDFEIIKVREGRLKFLSIDRSVFLIITLIVVCLRA